MIWEFAVIEPQPINPVGSEHPHNWYNEIGDTYHHRPDLKPPGISQTCHTVGKESLGMYHHMKTFLHLVWIAPLFAGPGEDWRLRFRDHHGAPLQLFARWLRSLDRPRRSALRKIKIEHPDEYSRDYAGWATVFGSLRALRCPPDLVDLELVLMRRGSKTLSLFPRDPLELEAELQVMAHEAEITKRYYFGHDGIDMIKATTVMV